MPAEEFEGFRELVLEVDKTDDDRALELVLEHRENMSGFQFESLMFEIEEAE
jgi:hypothetical protein